MTKEGQKGEGKSQRLRERFELALPVRVQCRESLDHEWIEMSRLVDVTPFGARLRLKRPTETGRLLLLTLPMPRPLRCFDHVEDQYRVWSLVRNVKLLDPGSDKGRARGNRRGVCRQASAAKFRSGSVAPLRYRAINQRAGSSGDNGRIERFALGNFDHRQAKGNSPQSSRRVIG